MILSPHTRLWPVCCNLSLSTMALKLQLVCEIEYELIYKKKNHTLGHNIYEPSLLETVSWGFITSGNSGGVE